MNIDVRELSNEMLIAIMDKRVEFEVENEAEIVDFIREVMVRRLYLELGATSMYDFLTRAHYSYAPQVAQRKLDAARLIVDFPEVKELLRSGDLNLTQVGMFASALRQKTIAPELQRETLKAMCGQTVHNTQIVLNEKFEIEPKARTKTRVQRDGSVRVEMTFSKEEWEIVSRAREVVSHSVPGGELEKVLTYCAQVTVAKKRSTSLSEVERVIFERDQSCRWVHADGSVCGSRYQLQIDHIHSRWAGGGDEVENLQLLCGVHNRYKFRREAG